MPKRWYHYHKSPVNEIKASIRVENEKLLRYIYPLKHMKNKPVVNKSQRRSAIPTLILATDSLKLKSSKIRFFTYILPTSIQQKWALIANSNAWLPMFKSIITGLCESEEQQPLVVDTRMFCHNLSTEKFTRMNSKKSLLLQNHHIKCTKSFTYGPILAGTPYL